MPLEAGAGEAEFELAGDQDLHLVVSALCAGGPRAERFGWAYRLDEVIEEEPEDDGAGCACAYSTRRGPGVGWLGFLWLALAARRER